jgi:hypothetical protein
LLHEIGEDRIRVGLDLHDRLPAVDDHKVRVGQICIKSGVPGNAASPPRRGQGSVPRWYSLRRLDAATTNRKLKHRENNMSVRVISVAEANRLYPPKQRKQKTTKKTK